MSLCLSVEMPEEGFNLSESGVISNLKWVLGNPWTLCKNKKHPYSLSHHSSSTKLSDIDSGSKSSPHACKSSSLLIEYLQSLG